MTDSQWERGMKVRREVLGDEWVAQGFFLYGFEPVGNRIEVTTGGYFVYDPDPEPTVWSEAERAKGQAWGVKTVESFHTYGTPVID